MQNDLNINLETISDGFFRYIVKLFQVGFRTSGNLSKMEGVLIKLIKVVQKFPSIASKFLDITKNNTLPTWLFLPYLPHIMHILNNQNMTIYFTEIFLQLAKKYKESFVYQFNVSFETENDCKTPLAKYLFKFLRHAVPLNFEFMDALNQVTHP